MKIFQKKESIVQNITFMGIMAAINIVFVLLTTYVFPALFFLLVFILPLTSVVVTLLCKKRYFIFYFVATVAICLVSTLNDFSQTILYVIPSLISGFVFGILIEKKVPTIWNIFLCSWISFGFTYLGIPIIKLQYGADPVFTFIKVFHLESFAYVNYLIPSFIFFIALAQSLISYAVIKTQSNKLGFECVDSHNFVNYIVGFCCAILTVGFAFLVPEISYLFSFCLVYFGVYEICYLFQKEARISIYFSFGALLVTILMFVFLYQFINKPLGFLLYGVFFVLVLIIGLVNNCLTKERKQVE